MALDLASFIVTYAASADGSATRMEVVPPSADASEDYPCGVTGREMDHLDRSNRRKAQRFQGAEADERK